MPRRANKYIEEIRQRPWCNLTDSGDFTERNRDRFSARVHQDNFESWQFVLGKTIADPNLIIQATVDSECETEDMPWGNSRGLLVSTRLRQLIESIAPNQAQFIPAQIRHPGSDQLVQHLGQPYWMMNTLLCIDITDRVQSEYHIVQEDDGRVRYSFDRHVVDVSRIPRGAMLVRDFNFKNCLIVHATLRDAILDSKMTGCQFYPVGLTNA